MLRAFICLFTPSESFLALLFIIMLRLPRLLCVLVLLSLGWSAASAGCRISNRWSLDVEGRGTRDVYSILPAPYCLLLSDLWQNGTGAFYALDVVAGRAAWQWPNTTVNNTLSVMQQVVDLQPSTASSERVYGLVTFMTSEGGDGQACAAFAALRTRDGTILYNRTFCFPSYMATASVVVIPPIKSRPERLVLVVGGYTVDSYALVHVMNAASGRLLSTANVSAVLTYETQSVHKGRQGYFTINTAPLQTPQLYLLGDDNHVHLVTNNPRALIGAVLRSQPALQYDNPNQPSQLLASDVRTDKQVWSSKDPFLVGAQWGRNETFSHFSTTYQLLDSDPGRFLVLNCAYDHNKTVVAAVGLHALSDGQEVARSAVFTFSHLYHAWANPTTWEFDDILLLRGDTVWYTLQLPSLKLVQQGHYATEDASLQSNNWVVDADGSYVALMYGDNTRITATLPTSTTHQSGRSRTSMSDDSSRRKHQERARMK